MITVVPNNTDYATEKEVVAAWNKQIDFLVEDLECGFTGKLVNKSDILACSIDSVKILYNDKQNNYVFIAKVKKKK
jgi:hypothetical protein